MFCKICPLFFFLVFRQLFFLVKHSPCLAFPICGLVQTGVSEKYRTFDESRLGPSFIRGTDCTEMRAKSALVVEMEPVGM